MTTAGSSQATAQPRIARHAIAALVVEVMIVALPLNAAYGFVIRFVQYLDWTAGLFFGVIACAVAANAYVLYARFVARRVPEELALRRWRGFPFGFSVGAVLICAVLALISIAGAVWITSGGIPTFAALPAVPLVAGVFEELIARGVILRNLENVFGSLIAIVLCAALFGCLHIGNAHATSLSTAAVGLEGGVMLACVYIYTRSLWWTIGVHAGWNFAQTTIFGIADSGNAGAGLLHTAIDAPQWLSGGAFGVEASVVAVAVCATVSIGLLIACYRRGMIIAPLWQTQR